MRTFTTGKPSHSIAQPTRSYTLPDADDRPVAKESDSSNPLLTQQDGMYPIRTVAALSGVNPVTLRAWERRYGLIKPTRTPKGHRLYSEEDVALVRRIVALLDQGIPISQARRLLAQEIETAVPDTGASQARETWTSYRQRMTDAVSRFDARVLDAVYNDALSLYPMDLVTRQLLTPLIRQVGERAQSDPVAMAEQNFLRVYLRNKLGARYHHQSTQARGPKLLAACLPGEDDELEGLLFSLAILTHGYQVVQLGSNTPLGPLKTVVKRSACRAVVLYGDISPSASIIYGLLPDLLRSVSVPVLVAGSVSQRYGTDLERLGAIALSPDLGQAMAQLDAALASVKG